MDKLAERPPYVAFETRPVENRTKSLAAENGLPVYDDVPFAIITPPGSKDQIERVAADWFAEKAAQVRAGRWPAEWHQAFKGAFDAWLKDEEPPVNGLSIKQWPGLTKTQYDALRAIRVMTVEDVAAMNEEAIGRLGMGGRSLKQRAQEFLTTAKDVGASAERIAALQAQVTGLQGERDGLVKRLEALEAQLPKAK